MRLYVDAPFAAGAKLPVERAQAHYLGNVMRFKLGDTLAIFNGRDGEWRAAIAEMRRDTCTLVAETQTRPQQAATGPVLLFAPLKPARSAMLIEKACELGVSEFWPILSHHTQSGRIKLDRYRAHAVEAAEQCGRMEVPPVRPLASLEKLLGAWPSARRLLFCDEAGGPPGLEVLSAAPPVLWAILVGPEGGFSPQERTLLRSYPFCVPVSLGPRILRAETAALAALSLWQATVGDLRAGSSDPIS
ncbi:MAG: 16S rRNA (uracil(1498)-N(3))-methyltransferase [Proteobacteria bacterium]|nr:16S rRNA (uracil(1498)-N(3))-methyltransferase [Pseudomonadota bacterium]MDA1355561.1 16S rRNA (uracil(1498)-N(3))-methyltransferase [Pseudomonadota bacterium]